MSITLRGYAKDDIVNSIETFFNMIESLNVGPIVNDAMSKLSSDEGFLGQLKAAQTKDEMLTVLSSTTQDQEPEYGIMMSGII